MNWLVGVVVFAACVVYCYFMVVCLVVSWYIAIRVYLWFWVAVFGFWWFRCYCLLGWFGVWLRFLCVLIACAGGCCGFDLDFAG